MTVVWNVENLKVPHKDLFEATRLAEYLIDIYGGREENLGKVHNYLGIDLDY